MKLVSEYLQDGLLLYCKVILFFVVMGSILSLLQLLVLLPIFIIVAGVIIEVQRISKNISALRYRLLPTSSKIQFIYNIVLAVFLQFFLQFSGFLIAGGIEFSILDNGIPKNEMHNYFTGAIFISLYLTMAVIQLTSLIISLIQLKNADKILKKRKLYLGIILIFLVDLLLFFFNSYFVMGNRFNWSIELKLIFLVWFIFSSLAV